MALSRAFKKLPYNIIGDTFEAQQKDLSIQSTSMMYPVIVVNSLSSTAALLPFPGLKPFSTNVSTEPDRGIYKRQFSSRAWKVSGPTLYSFDSTGTQTNEGSIAGSQIVTFADNGNVLLICNGSTLFQHDGATLTTLSPGFTSVMVDFLNDQFIVLDTTNTVRIADVGVATFTTANKFQAESIPDELTAIKVFNQTVFNFGERSIEPWQNTGAGTPPFSRMNGAIIEDIGIATRDAVCATATAIYFFGFDRIPYRIINFQAEKLTAINPGIAKIFATYDLDRVYLQCFKYQGQNIILYFFREDLVVWGFHEETGTWFKVDHDVDGQFWLGRTVAYLFGKLLVGDRVTGDVYELDIDTYTNNGTPIARERVFRPLSGEMVGDPREYIQMKMIQFAVETGIGIDDDNPQMMVSYSTDGGRSFSSEVWVLLGEAGDYQQKVETYSNRKFKDLTVKVRYTGNTSFSMYDAAIYIRPAGQ